MTCHVTFTAVLHIAHCRQKVFKYWNQDANLGTGTLERLGRLLPVLYSAHTEQHFLPYCTNLLLELTSRSPDYSRMMFDQPLSECKFNVSQSYLL